MADSDSRMTIGDRLRAYLVISFKKATYLIVLYTKKPANHKMTAG